MAQRAGDADGIEALSGIIEETTHAYDGIQLQERERRSGILEVDLSLAQGRAQGMGQRIRVDLQPGSQRRDGRQARADAAICLAGNRLVQAQRPAPEGFIAERVEPEDTTTLADRLQGIVIHTPVEMALLLSFAARLVITGECVSRRTHHG